MTAVPTPPDDAVYWISDEGEILAPHAPGATPVYRDEVPLPGLRERVEAANAGHKEDEVFEIEEADEHWLPDWFLLTLCRLEAEEAAVREKFKADLRSIKARRASLRWRWMPRFRRAVEVLVARGRNKSIALKGGRAGHRKPRGVDVSDRKAAIDWLIDNGHFEAIKTTAPDLLVSKIPEGLEVPGIVRPTEDEFFFTVSKPKQEGE